MLQATERLDRLVSEIRSIQRPNMNGENPADVLLVWLRRSPLRLFLLNSVAILTPLPCVSMAHTRGS